MVSAAYGTNALRPFKVTTLKVVLRLTKGNIAVALASQISNLFMKPEAGASAPRFPWPLSLPIYVNAHSYSSLGHLHVPSSANPSGYVYQTTISRNLVY